jgi:RimJ/RimL family protein N-acetyltransferase
MIHAGYTEHGHTIARLCGATFDPENDRVVSFSRKGNLLGGALFSGYTGASITAHMAGTQRNWASKEVLFAVFDYVFRQLSCERVFGFIKANNERALTIAKKLGFNEIVVIPRVYSDTDVIVVCLEKSDCRWMNKLEVVDGNVQIRSAARPRL